MSLTADDLLAWETALAELDGPRPTPAAAARAESLAKHAGPLDLKCALDPTSVRTPALQLISDELERLVTTPGARLIVSCPPQQGKSETTNHAVIRALQHHPDWRVALTSYAEWLAARNSGAVRDLIAGHGTGAADALTGEPLPDRIGLSIDPMHSAERAWKLAGHRGGCIARGVGSGMTGAPVDFLVCDDPLKDDRDANSPTIRKRLYEWWRTVAETRLAPDAPVLVIATRWHELDLSGWLIDNDDSGEWNVVNIPALADGRTPDALGRPAGEWLVSARGTSPEQWVEIRRRAGERVFAALHQGIPAPVEGGIFKSAWFSAWRVPESPKGCDPPVVVVDPADGGDDEAGIILAAVHRQSGKVYIIDDLSAAMTVARWARVALLTCIRRDAPRLVYEQSLSQLPARIRAVWQELHTQAQAVANSGSRDEALARLVRADDPPDLATRVGEQLDELSADDVAEILRTGAAGPSLQHVTAKGTKESRMTWAAPLFEVGKVCMVGRHPQLEHQAATWQPGRDSPDRVDAMVHACALLQVGSPRVRWM